MSSAKRDAAQSLLPLTPLYFQVLLALADAPRHGYGMLKEIERQTGGRMKPATGTLYLALQRMHDVGLVENVRSRPPGSDSRRRYYAITGLGREVACLEAERLAHALGEAIRKNLTPPGTVRNLAVEPR